MIPALRQRAYRLGVPVFDLIRRRAMRAQVQCCNDDGTLKFRPVLFCNSTLPDGWQLLPRTEYR